MQSQDQVLPVDKQYAHSFLSLWGFFALIFQLIPSKEESHWKKNKKNKTKQKKKKKHYLVKSFFGANFCSILTRVHVL